MQAGVPVPVDTTGDGQPNMLMVPTDVDGDGHDVLVLLGVLLPCGNGPDGGLQGCFESPPGGSPTIDLSTRQNVTSRRWK